MYCYSQGCCRTLRVCSDNDVKSREIHAIYVFDTTGVILTHDRGYFDSDANIELDIACVKKVKVDFNCKTAFVISHKNNYSWEELKYDLYIPASALGLKKPIYTKEDMWKRIKKTTKTKIDGVEFNEYKFLDRKLWALWTEMEEDIKKLSHYYLTDNIAVFDNAMTHLKKLRSKYGKELERIDNYTVEQAIAEGF